MEAVYFTNWTDEDFTHKWDSKPYTVKAGESVYFPDFLARHMAKHLANREVVKRKKEVSDPLMTEFIKKCFSTEKVIHANDKVDLEAKLMNADLPRKTKEEKLAERKTNKNSRTKEDEFEGK